MLYSGPWEARGFNGFEASGTFKLVSHVGAEANFVAAFSPTNQFSLRTVMGGPRLSANFGQLAPYGHLLFGALTFNTSGLTNTATSFALVLGGGADLWITRHIGARLIQFDYLRNNNSAAVLGFEHPSGTTGPGNRYRIATGIVFRFGS